MTKTEEHIVDELRALLENLEADARKQRNRLDVRSPLAKPLDTADSVAKTMRTLCQQAARELDQVIEITTEKLR